MFLINTFTPTHMHNKSDFSLWGEKKEANYCTSLTEMAVLKYMMKCIKSHICVWHMSWSTGKRRYGQDESRSKQKQKTVVAGTRTHS